MAGLLQLAVALSVATTMSAVCDNSTSYALYKCGSGECIPRRLRCDGRNDCQDGSDERSTYCNDETNGRNYNNIIIAVVGSVVIIVVVTAIIIWGVKCSTKINFTTRPVHRGGGGGGIHSGGGGLDMYGYGGGGGNDGDNISYAGSCGGGGGGGGGGGSCGSGGS